MFHVNLSPKIDAMGVACAIERWFLEPESESKGMEKTTLTFHLCCTYCEGEGTFVFVRHEQFGLFVTIA